MKFLKKNSDKLIRLLSKLAPVRNVGDGSECRTGVYTGVEFRTKSILFFCCFLFSNLLWANSAEEELAGRLNHVKTFSAQFDQKVWDAEKTLLQHASGDIQLIRPGLFYWHVISPQEQMIWYRDHQVISYDPSLEQAIVKKDFSNNDASLLPLMLLTGDAHKALANFFVSTDKNRYTLKPKKINDSTLIIEIILELNKSDELQEIDYKTTLQQMTAVVFTDQKMNLPLPAQAFYQVLPPKTDVIYDN